jgi:GT2 family glycosyltransferase
LSAAFTLDLPWFVVKTRFNEGHQDMTRRMQEDVDESQSVGRAGSKPIVVAMLTYRRPGDLAEAIPAILGHSTASVPAATLVVVDNDPQASARDTVEGFADRGVRYLHEPKPGIAAARNRALTSAPRGALLIFIDDDERPQDRWLELLLATYERHQSAAVVGPVISEYDVEPDEWIRAGRFFDRRRLPTGTRVDVAATNNLLLDLDQVDALGLRFDEKFGQSGGSDTLFTRQLVAAGGEIVWCDEAVVTDKVPAARLTHRWVLNRAFRSGNSWTLTSLELAGSVPQRLWLRSVAAALGLVRVVGGASRFVLGTLTGSIGHRARGHRTIMRGAGMVAGIFGYTYHEYRHKPVRSVRG